MHREREKEKGISIHLSTYPSIRPSSHLYVYCILSTYPPIKLFICNCVSIWIPLHVCMCVCDYACDTCIYIYIYIYIYIHPGAVVWTALAVGSNGSRAAGVGIGGPHPCLSCTCRGGGGPAAPSVWQSWTGRLPSRVGGGP